MRNKRRWAWKRKHVRKHQFTFKKDGPDKDFRSFYHRGNRLKERMDLGKIEKGLYDVDTNPKYHPSSAKWDWW